MVKYVHMTFFKGIDLFTVNTRQLIIVFLPFRLASTHCSPCCEVFLCWLWANGNRQTSFWQVWARAFTLDTVHLGAKVSPYLLAGISPLLDSRHAVDVLRYFGLCTSGGLGSDCRLCSWWEEKSQGFGYLLSNNCRELEWTFALQALYSILFLGPSHFVKKCVLQVSLLAKLKFSLGFHLLIGKTEL